MSVTLQVDENALNKRYEQGWVVEKSSNLDDVINLIKKFRMSGQPVSIGYLGNVVDLW